MDDAEELFDVQIPDYGKGAKLPNSVEYVATDAQRDFLPDDKIEFFSYGNEDTKRGIEMWMEPLQVQTPKRPAKEQWQKDCGQKDAARLN